MVEYLRISIPVLISDDLLAQGIANASGIHAENRTDHQMCLVLLPSKKQEVDEKYRA